MPARWIGEIQVQCHKRPALCLTDFEQRRILLAAQRLIENTDRIVPSFTQKQSDFLRQILIDFESHAALRPEMSMIRSRANSAA